MAHTLGVSVNLAVRVVKRQAQQNGDAHRRDVGAAN